MKSYLVSWLARNLARDMERFAREKAGPWLVWEPGPWRPPLADRSTIAEAGQGRSRSSSGEALALEVTPVPGRTASEGIRLGRGPENDLVVDDGTLSRAHLLLKLVEGRWFVEDLHSSNGTRVNGEPLGDAAVPIEPGARIEAGSVCLTFYDARGFYLRLRHGVI